MNKGKYVFAQITHLIRKNEFDKIVDKLDANRNSRKLCSWNHLLQLLFGQITACNSLRNIALCLNAHKDKLYHLGIKAQVNESTLSRANETRDARLFAQFGEFMINIVRPYYCNTKIAKLSIDNEIFALDSTTISLSIKLFEWAQGKYSRGAVKVHTLLNLRGNIPSFIHITDGKYDDSNALDVMPIEPNAIYVMDRAYTDFAALYNVNKCGSYYVTRAKSNMRFKAVKSAVVDKSTGVKCDQHIKLTNALSFKRYPSKLRRVKYLDKDSGEVLVFITNNFDITALEVAQIYKQRWQIEVFFKWIKQNLVVKKLWGHSPNAVKIHIWVAIITYLLVAYIKAIYKSEFSIYEIIQILGISILSKEPINELITKNNSKQNVKEQPNLFSVNNL